MSEMFIVWLSQELRNRGMSMRELARASNMSQPNISRVLSGKQAVTVGFCASVARALDVQQDKLLWMAGLIDQLPDTPREAGPTNKELLEMFASLSERDQKEILAIAHIKLEQQRIGGKRGKTRGN